MEFYKKLNFINFFSFFFFILHLSTSHGKFFLVLSSGADAINISGLLVQEYRLLNTKKLGNFIN